MRVLLIDDHPLILAALQTVIEGLGENVQVLGADSAAQARETLQARQDFDLVLLDLNLGDASGFDVLEEFRAQYPSLPVVVISASDRASDVIRAIDQGAMGFIPKRTSNEVLAQALKLVMSGGIYVPPMSLGSDSSADHEPARHAPGDAMDGHLAAGNASGHANGNAHSLSGKLHQVHALASQAGYQTATGLEGLQLTPRQTDVLALLLQGKPNKIIARELGVSVETIKDHVAAVLKALGVSSRTQAVLAVGQMVQRQPHAAFTTFR
ncbi:MAG: response regulator transcription factor [Burkholderiaceae bacterium]